MLLSRKYETALCYPVIFHISVVKKEPHRCVLAAILPSGGVKQGAEITSIVNGLKAII